MPRSRTGRLVTSAGLVTAAVASVLGSSAAAGAAAKQGHSVKMTLPRSIPPDPVFLREGVCGVRVADDSATCNGTILKALDDARTHEPLPPMPNSFNLAAFDRLTPSEQVFAIANIERTARGEPAMAGMTAQLDAVASNAAAHQIDPSISLPYHLTTGGSATTYGANFAEGTANAMGANYYWMYDDGLDSPNASCTQADQSACWAHRKNTLDDYENPGYCSRGSQVHILMGVAEVTSKVDFSPAITEIFVNDCGALPTDMVFTWPDVQRLVFGH
ncbi:MAG: hypothetical protein ABSH30_10515 [Acidimicrobiales bacterium]